MEIKLSNSNEATIVDPEVYELLKDKKISLTNWGYARFNENGKTITLHKYLFQHYNPSINIDKMQIDHINQNKLDNQIKNLRVATRSLNQLNKSKHNNNKCGIKNVCYDDAKNRWRFEIVNITLNDRKYSKAIYNTKSESLYALNYLADNVANNDEKEFLCIDDNNFDEISEVRKEIIKADLDEYITNTQNKTYKQLEIKSDKKYISKDKNKYKIQITIFNKRYFFGLYNTLDTAKLYRDFLVELFNSTDADNINEMVDKAKITFENNEVIMHKIIHILNKKINIM